MHTPARLDTLPADLDILLVSLVLIGLLALALTVRAARARRAERDRLARIRPRLADDDPLFTGWCREHDPGRVTGGLHAENRRR